jgi:hypothetical protein
MDEMKLRKALALLQSLADELPPRGDIEEKYVNIYHQTLTDIESETGQELSYFSIPPTELERHITSIPGPRIGRHGGGEPTYTQARYCDRARFFIGFRGAINFINSFMQGSGKNPIGFAHPG